MFTSNTKLYIFNAQGTLTDLQCNVTNSHSHWKTIINDISEPSFNWIRKCRYDLDKRQCIL